MSKILKALVIILLMVTTVTSIYYYLKYDELVGDLKKTNLENRSYVDFYEVDNNEIIEKDENVYISFEIFKRFMAKDSYLSNSRTRIYIPVSNIEVDTSNPEVDRFIKNNLKNINLPVITEGDKKYVRLDLVNRLYDLKYISYQESNNRYLFTENEDVKDSLVIKTSKFYARISDDYIGLGKINKNYLTYSDGFRAVNLDDGRVRVVNEEGILGYVNREAVLESNSSLGKYELTNISSDIKLDKPFHLSWDQVSAYEKNMKLEDTSSLNGVDVLSPVWFSLNVEGIVINAASLDYVNNAHRSDKFVWALYNNDFDPDWTNDLLSSSKDMDKSIAQLLMYSYIYGFDGINIDFENMYLKNRDDFANYVSYLSSWIKKAGMISSIDVTVPWGSDMWSKVYDREKLSESVDYVMLMAYDEYWASSQKAGSVASKDWTRRGVVESLNLIPRDKLILGMPLYTRIWEKSNSSGRMKSSVLSVKNTGDFIKDNNLDVRYDDSTGQNYSEYAKDNNLYRIWFEDETSIIMRLNLRKEYDLPGIGTWSLEFADKKYFDFIEENIK